ncbi:threonine/serine exporter family protein [Clostridium tyrobutyricum]|uniref:threonine/serine exporter family protein n=1 Tax=Clostridium tyrobutyricum TaxID=1519 RepID=UPI001C38D569|nr:threonine/serine exporter family protein [Clostridium tyrobutyricum]MBV4418660.1 threonine/serine exporter family protein [Clostridium tyrobutyricum]
MDINRTINIAAYAGKILLESGAEIYRVEETITRICHSCGILKVDAYVTINVIIISAESNYDKTVSLIKRVKRGSQNLEKISRVNNISRHIKDSGYTLEDIYKKLQKIDRLKTYSYKLNIFSSGGASGFFCLVFGGNIRDFAISFIIGCLIKLVSSTLSYLQANEFFINIICGAIAALIALVSTKLNLSIHTDTVIIGSIMLLVPGVAITNSIRDTIAGDLLSGVLGGVEALLVAVAIAVGTGIVMRLWLITGGFSL